jgi:hypothetical protein
MSSDAAASCKILRTGEAIALAYECTQRATIRAIGTPLQAIVDALSRIDEIDAGAAVRLEEIGLIQLEILAVFIGDQIRIGIVGRHDESANRFEDLREPIVVLNEGIPHFSGDLGKDPPSRTVLGIRRRIDVVRVIRIDTLDIVPIRLQRCRQVHQVTVARRERQMPAARLCTRRLSRPSTRVRFKTPASKVK